MLVGGLGAVEDRDGWVTYIVLEVQSVDIFRTALGLLCRDSQVRASDARPVDDGVNIGCLGTLGRGRTLGHSGSKVDALSAFDGLDDLSGDH